MKLNNEAFIRGRFVKREKLEPTHLFTRASRFPRDSGLGRRRASTLAVGSVWRVPGSSNLGWLTSVGDVLLIGVGTLVRWFPALFTGSLHPLGSRSTHTHVAQSSTVERSLSLTGFVHHTEICWMVDHTRILLL